jgi:hypothetical protein
MASETRKCGAKISHDRQRRHVYLVNTSITPAKASMKLEGAGVTAGSCTTTATEIDEEMLG